MQEILLNSFQTYYGLDWASMLLGFYGTWLVTEKNRMGFLFLIVSVSLAAITAIIANQFGFVAANMINAFIAVRGYIKWKTIEIKEMQ